MSGRVSLRMIAERAGVSIAAVSMALRHRGTLSESLSEELRGLAMEMGYRPNPLLASLASKRFRSAKSAEGTPVALFSFPTIPGGQKRASVKYLKNLMEMAASLGYAPTAYDFPSRQSGEALSRELYHRKVPGIIVVGSLDEKLLGRSVDWSQFSVVQCGRFVASEKFHTVRPNVFQAIKLTFNQLRSRGYQRIGFAVCRHDFPLEDDEARYGAAIAMERAYLPRKHQLPVHQGPISDATSFLAWVKACKPDAVVGFSEASYWLLKDAGYEVPASLGFASLHLASVKSETLCSGLFQNLPQIARQSVLLLDQLITSQERGMVEQPMHLLVPSTWHEGKTLRQVSPA